MEFLILIYIVLIIYAFIKINIDYGKRKKSNSIRQILNRKTK